MPGWIVPGQRMTMGTRKAPSQLVSFSPRNGVAAAVRPGQYFGPVVGREDDDGVVGNAEVVELLEQLADIAVQFHHAVGINPKAGLALRCRLQVRPHVHAGGD